MILVLMLLLKKSTIHPHIAYPFVMFVWNVYTVVHSNAQEGRCRMRVVQYHCDDDDPDEPVTHLGDGGKLDDIVVHT